MGSDRVRRLRKSGLRLLLRGGGTNGGSAVRAPFFVGRAALHFPRRPVNDEVENLPKKMRRGVDLSEGV